MKDYIETQYKNLDFTIPDDYVSRREVYAMLDYIGGIRKRKRTTETGFGNENRWREKR